MANQPVPLANVTTTGVVRLGKDLGDVDVVPFSLECRITPSTAAVKHAFPIDLPANAVVDAVHIHPYAASTQAGGSAPTSVGIGVTGDPDEYIEILESTVDEVGENVTTIANRVSPSASAKTLYLHSTNGSGTGAGDIYGDWGIRVTGYVIQPLATS